MTTEVSLELDHKASESINELMNHFGVETKAEIFLKAIAVLTMVARIEKTDGELFARKGTDETKIITR
jgi:hypothetical protein